MCVCVCVCVCVHVGAHAYVYSVDRNSSANKNYCMIVLLESITINKLYSYITMNQLK